METLLWCLVIGANIWCAILTLVALAQAEMINVLKGRSQVDEDLWRKQLEMNDMLEKDLSRCEDEIGL